MLSANKSGHYWNGTQFRKVSYYHAIAIDKYDFKNGHSLIVNFIV